jgi:hypothetical protein
MVGLRARQGKAGKVLWVKGIDFSGVAEYLGQRVWTSAGPLL